MIRSFFEGFVDAMEAIVQTMIQFWQSIPRRLKDNTDEKVQRDRCTIGNRCAICRAQDTADGNPFKGNPMGSPTHHVECDGRLAIVNDDLVVCVGCEKGWPAPQDNKSVGRYV